MHTRCVDRAPNERITTIAGRMPLNPNSEAGMGSARGPRAGSGGSPEPSSLTFGSKSRVRKCVGRGFRRAAENHTPAANSDRHGVGCAGLIWGERPC